MTIRQFKLLGHQLNGTGTITMNGTPVFEGAFLPLYQPIDPNNGSTVEWISTGSVYIDNALASTHRQWRWVLGAINQYIMVPVSITVTSGQIGVALFEWNYAQVKNPIYSDEQWAIVTNPESTAAQRLAIYKVVAVPLLTDADKIMLLTTGPEDRAARSTIINTHGLTTKVQDSTQFAYGVTPEDYACNRINVLLNGVEPLLANTNQSIAMNTGDVLTATLMVFASNLCNDTKSR